jgi:uncharacterized protein (TIGR02145 family)
MTKNLNYGGVCYNNAASCDVYGRLYNWNAAITAAPPGWHLPSDAEWQTLINYLGGTAVAGGKLKEAGTTHWISPNTGGDNSTHFAALPGGHFDLKLGGYYFMGSEGNWWSSTEDGSGGVWTFNLYYNNASVSRGSQYKETEISVRCIRD